MHSIIGRNMSVKREVFFALICFILVCSFFPLASALDLSTHFVVSTGGATSANFDLNSLLLKVSLKQGDSLNRTLSVAKGEGQEIFLSVVNVKGVSLSQDKFILGGETRTVDVIFNSSDLKEGIYIGSIKINDATDIMYLPVIFEVESSDLFYDINLDVTPKYSEVAPGDKLVAQVKIFDLTSGGTQEGLGPSTVNIDYNIYSFEGNLVQSESESLIVDRQAQVTKTIFFPESIGEGYYVFSAVVRHSSSVGISSYLFSISKPQDEILVFGKETDLKFISIIALISLIFVGSLLFFIYIVKDRDRLVLEMKRYNHYELQRQREILIEQEKILHARNKFPKEKIKSEIKEKIAGLKLKQKKRIESIKELQKKEDIEAMRMKLKKWKKEGYNTSYIDYKLKGLSNSEMGEILRKWKKKYS